MSLYNIDEHIKSCFKSKCKISFLFILFFFVFFLFEQNSPSARRRVNLSGHTETESFEMGSKDSFNFDLTDDHSKTQEK